MRYKLKEAGVAVKLRIIGCRLEIPHKVSDIEVIGFLDKDREEERQQLFSYYLNSDFFILPTQAECVGMSFLEASSAALPSIGTTVGGVPEAVSHNETGFIIGPSVTAANVAKWIFSVKNESVFIPRCL